MYNKFLIQCLSFTIPSFVNGSCSCARRASRHSWPCNTIFKRQHTIAEGAAACGMFTFSFGIREWSRFGGEGPRPVIVVVCVRVCLCLFTFCGETKFASV